MGDEAQKTVPELVAVEPSTDPMIGFRWLDYFVDKKLGEGGMGCVYRLRHAKWSNRYFAMKVLNADSPQHLVDRFQQEADVAAAIENHRVVKPIHHAQLVDGRWYIVMEYVDGRSLADEIAAGPLSVKDALQIGVRIAETMTEMHRVQFVHRDLKPANIMLTTEGNRDRLVKLLDFGVVKASGEKRVVSTQVGVNVGTPGYWSPEAAMAQEQDGRTDVFSLGVILFEMLTGRLPFPFDTNDGPAAVAAATSLLTNEAPNVSAVRPPHKDPVPKDLEMTIARALAKKPDARLTMADLFAALNGSYERLSHQAGIVRAPLPTQLSAAPPILESFDKKPTLAKPRPDLDRVLDKYSSGPTPTVPLAAPSSAASRPTRRRSRAWLVFGVGAAVATLVAGVWMLGTRRISTHPNEPSAPRQPSELPPPTMTPSPAQSAASPPAAAPHERPAASTSPAVAKPNTRSKKSPRTTKPASPPTPLLEPKQMNDRVIDPFGGK